MLDYTPVAFCNGFPIKDLKTQEELDPADSILFDQNGPVWLLRNVAVKKECQGKGLGKLLVNRQIKLAKEYGASFMRFTATTNFDNFYQSLGFEIISPAKSFHGIEQSVWEMRL